MPTRVTVAVFAVIYVFIYGVTINFLMPNPDFEAVEAHFLDVLVQLC